MGSTDSKCAELLEQMDWEEPPFAEEFRHPSLVSYLQVQNLEVILPKHAPQADLSNPEMKPHLFPRPNFCWEAYKMHLALIGPSTACKEQFLAFMPKLVAMFRGVPAKLAPGRDAVPHYFFDPDLHKMVLWELPEINWNQTRPDDYIKEIGLMYMDCVFLLFSEKYLLNDLYCKLVVNMAIHGIPFFVICTDSQENADKSTMDKIKSYFQRKDIAGVRMLNPKDPGETLKELLTEFFKEVSWNRSAIDKERTADVSEAVLGQTVRLKDLEKKPELNGRCGVCVGYDKPQSRYHIRLITAGVESDIALKQQNFSILKPKLLDAMVRIKDLTSKPELNGRYGYVDAFLRETERYRVLLPERNCKGEALSLKAANLERVEVLNAKPIAAPAPEPKKMADSAAKTPSKPSHGPYVADCTGGQVWQVVGGEGRGGIIVKKGRDFQSEAEPQRLSTNALLEEIALVDGRLYYRLLYGTGPKKGWVSINLKDKDLVVRSDAVVCGSRTARSQPTASPKASDAPAPKVDPVAPKAEPERFDPPERSSASAPAKQKPAAPREDDDLGGFMPKKASGEEHGTNGRAAAAASQKPSEKEDDDLSYLLPSTRPSKEVPPDLMSRILAEDEEQEAREAREAAPARAAASEAPAARDSEPRRESAPPPEEAPKPIYKLSRAGLLAMDVWAVVGDAGDAEDICDHLMDCGRTVFTVCPSGGYVAQVTDLNKDPNLPRTQVLAFTDDTVDPEECVKAAAHLDFRGVYLHPGLDAYPPGITERLQALGVAAFGGDILDDLQPGGGLAVAPLD